MDGIYDLLKTLPLPWLICFLSWGACGYALKALWQRANDLQDKNLADVKESAAKLAALNEKINDTLEALIAVYKGGKKNVR